MLRNIIIKGKKKQKMGDRAYWFNLPPVKTCTPTRWCLKGRSGKPMCYALNGQCKLDHVINACEQRYSISLRDDFAEMVITEIQKKNVEYFRVHMIGDFYSTDYIYKWIKIVKNCPNTLFRTTTRRRNFTKTLRKLNALSNMIIRESLDTERTEPKMGLPFAALSRLKITNTEPVLNCIEKCDKCGYLCWQNPSNTSFDEFYPA